MGFRRSERHRAVVYARRRTRTRRRVGDWIGMERQHQVKRDDKRGRHILSCSCSTTLSLNVVFFRHLMASGSTEHSIRLWDLNRPAEAVHCNANAHKAGVQALQWYPILQSRSYHSIFICFIVQRNPNESVQLLSAGFDKKALLHDARSAAKPSTFVFLYSFRRIRFLISSWTVISFQNIVGSRAWMCCLVTKWF